MSRVRRTPPCTVVHLVEVKLGAGLSGTELHVADLAGHQLDHGDVRPVVLCVGSRALLPRLAGLGVSGAHISAADPWSGMTAARAVVLHRAVAVMHSHGGRANALAALLLRTRGWHSRRTSFVVTAHGATAVIGTPRTGRRSGDPTLERADRIVSVSVPEAEVLARRHGSAAVTYIPNGVRPPACPLSDERRGSRARPVVSFVGRLSPEKRPDLFLEAAARVAAAVPGARFVLAGEGPERPRLERQRHDLGLDDRVDLPGFTEDPWRLLAQTDVLVCPSDTEGSPRIVLEAMAAGVPVVATAVGGVPHVIRGGSEGVVVAPGDAARLAVGVAGLLRSPGRAQRLARAAQARFRRDFTLDIMARRVASVYGEVGAA